jgi:two-component system sensor histidine kinase RegB
MHVNASPTIAPVEHLSGPRSFSRHFSSPTIEPPQIVLTWLVRLRWLAVAGQVLAITVARWMVGLKIAIVPIGGVMLLTALSNLIVVALLRRKQVSRWIVAAVIILDVCLLTVLLYCTGGAQNPFSILYIVHIVMSVVVLGPAWTWLIVAIACASFVSLFFFHRPLAADHPLSDRAQTLGQWIAFALVAVLIGYFVDRVTRALRMRERELSDVRERATRTEQLASLTTLAAGAAHELGTPLGTIAVIAKELELSLHDENKDDARMIREEVDRCRTILDRMRVDIVEDLHQKATTISLAEFLKRVRNDLQSAERSRLHVECAPGIQSITGPVRAIEQAIGVLLRNSFDAAPPESPVKLTIEHGKGETVFTVQDTGHGMPQDVLRRAGQPFFTTKPPGKGMGLGLFLVRLVAERYGGHFELASTPGVGTKTKLQIPDRVAGDEPAEGETSGANEDSGGR